MFIMEVNLKLKVVIVDDHPLARKGISLILSDDKDINSISEAANARDAVKIIEKEKPDIAIVDLKLGKDDGIELIERSKKISSTTKCIILSSFISAEEFASAEKAGADGYLLKDAYADDILYAVNLVKRGKKYYAPEIIARCSSGSVGKQVCQLTLREKEVLNELESGFSNEEIAKKLFITENTVKKHVSSILAKLNLKNRTQAAAFANKKLSI